MKVLIHDERTDALEFLLGSIVNYGYRAGIAKNNHEIMSMLSDDCHDVVLTNGNYEELKQEQHSRIQSSSVFVIGIKYPKRSNEAMDPTVDLYLYRPFEASELWQVLKSRAKANTSMKLK
jgi:PleD family two-component response regulator